jgi:hypothetical protein
VFDWYGIEPCYRLTAPGNDELFAGLDPCQKLREVGFGVVDVNLGSH